VCFQRLEKFRNHGPYAFGRLDELDAGSVRDHFLIDVGDARVRDPPLQLDGLGAERDAEVVKGIERERE
jgi:hypothetical protein